MADSSSLRWIAGQSNAYRLWRAFRQHGKTAFSEGRYGHPSKLRGAVRAFPVERCRHAPKTPSTIQAANWEAAPAQCRFQRRGHPRLLQVSSNEVQRLSRASAVAIQPCHALGYMGFHPLASRKRALLTRKERVRDVERLPSKSAARPGMRSHTAFPVAAASASA